MFACLTTINNNHANEPLVICNTFDNESLQYASSVGSNFTNPMVHASANPTINTSSDLLSIPHRSQAPSPDTHTDFEFSTSKKVEIQITDESIIPGPPLTSKGFPKVKVEDKATSLGSNHSGDAQLWTDEDADDESDAGGLPALLPSATIYTTPPHTVSHIARQNHHLLKTLATKYNPNYAKAQKEQEDNGSSNSEDDKDDSSLGVGSIANPESPS